NRLKRSGYAAVSKVAELPEHKTEQMMTLLQSMRKIRTKRGDSMAPLDRGDGTADLDAVLFQPQFRELSAIVEEASFIALKGKVRMRQGQKQLIINQIKPVEMADIPHYLKAHLFIRITTNIKESSALQFLEKATRLYPGEHVVFVYHEADKRTYKLG